MMRARCSVYIATSLDGFIARGNGALDWLDAANATMPKGEDCGYGRFIADIDALVIGRLTFEDVLRFPVWPYGTRRVVVMSRSLDAVPADAPSTVAPSRDTPADLVARLTREGCSHLYVDGGVTIRSFLAAGLIDDITITVIPVLLGAGRRLFGALEADVHLELLSSRAYDFGFVQSTYRVRRDE